MTTDLDLFDYAEGKRRRDEGMANVSGTEAAAKWHAKADRVICQLAAMSVPFTSDDAHEMLPDDPPHANSWGALFGSASKRKLIERTGEYWRTKRASGHARMLAVWRGRKQA